MRNIGRYGTLEVGNGRLTAVPTGWPCQLPVGRAVGLPAFATIASAGAAADRGGFGFGPGIGRGGGPPRAVSGVRDFLRRCRAQHTAAAQHSRVGQTYRPEHSGGFQ